MGLGEGYLLMQCFPGDKDRDRLSCLPWLEGTNFSWTFSMRKLGPHTGQAPGEGMCAGVCSLEQGQTSSHHLLQEELGAATRSQWAVQSRDEIKDSADIWGFGHATWKGRKHRPCWPAAAAQGED